MVQSSNDPHALGATAVSLQHIGILLQRVTYHFVISISGSVSSSRRFDAPVKVMAGGTDFTRSQIWTSRFTTPRITTCCHNSSLQSLLLFPRLPQDFTLARRAAPEVHDILLHASLSFILFTLSASHGAEDSQ
jgi:hypothetical protein